MAEKSKLIVRVLPETLINLRRHSLEKSGAGKSHPIGKIVDELVSKHIPDYKARDEAHKDPKATPTEEKPAVVQES